MKVLCEEKFRDKNGVIKGYRIKYENGTARDVKAEELKANIKSGQIEVVNLTLTVDGRLIDKAYKKEGPEKNSSQLVDKNFEQLCAECELKVNYGACMNSNYKVLSSEDKKLGWGTVRIERDMGEQGIYIIMIPESVDFTHDITEAKNLYEDKKLLIKDMNKIKGIMNAVKVGKVGYDELKKFEGRTCFYDSCVPEIAHFELLMSICKSANKLNVFSEGFLKELVEIVNKVGRKKLRDHLIGAGYKEQGDEIEVKDNFGGCATFTAEQYSICLLLTLYWLGISSDKSDNTICQTLLIYSSCYKELLNCLGIYENCQKLVEKIIA